MPLVRFEVRNEYGLGEPELYRGAAKREDPKALLDGMTVAGLVGILRQLGDLAEFASDVFHELHEHVTATSARGRKLLTRIQHIEAALPSIEKAVQGQTSHIHFAYVAGSDWHANIQTEESHLLSSDLPRFIMDSYEECCDSPRLYLLDKFDTAGAGACLKRYSDPSYFKRALASSQLGRAEKVSKEKKVQKYKRKGSRLMNGEAQHSLSITQQSSSTQFASPSTDGQSISSENTFISDVRLKPEVASTFTFFNSKTRLNNIDQVSDANPSVVPDELESDNSSVSKSQINHNDVCVPTLHDGPIGDHAEDYSQHDILQGPGVSRLPSVTWDEKTEIVKPTSPQSCNDVCVDMVQDSESLEVRCEPLYMDHEIDNAREEQEDILFDIENLPVSMSAGNHFDEANSETDNYMDALNTMESEIETDSECYTKQEVKARSNCSNQGLESGMGKIPQVADSNVDACDVEAPIASNNSLNKDVSSKFSDSDHSEGLDYVHTPHRNGFAPIPDHSLGSDLSESTINDICRTNSIEDPNGSLTPESSTVGDRTPASASELQELPVRIPSISAAMFWTNGGLLGVEPSKPPDLNTPDTVCETILPGGPFAISDTVTTTNESVSRNSYSVEKINTSPNISNSVNQSSLGSEQLTRGECNVQPIDHLKCSSVCHDDQHVCISVKLNFQKPVQSPQLSEPERFQIAAFNGVCAHTHRPDLREAKAVTSGAALSNIHNVDTHSSQSGQTSLSISSSLSGLAQRLLANSLQRKASLTNSDIPVPSEIVSTDTRKSLKTTIPNKHPEVHSGVASHVSCEPMIRGKTEEGSFKKSISTSLHYPEQSSPPLEHMKISFHPMNGSETSKLKLDFSNRNLNEGVEDLMFPSFQLLPGPTVSLPDSAPESDDDTFCQSCPYSSEDLLSPRSDSNSELWEQDESSITKNHGIYDDSQGISASSASVISFVGFQEMNYHSIDPAIGLGNLEIENDRFCLQSGPIAADLPGLDSVECLINKQERETDASSINPIDSGLQSPNDLPPPPLPPVQWMMMKSTFTSGEEKNSVDSERVHQIDGSQDRRLTSNQPQGHGIPKPQLIAEAVALPNTRTHRVQKLNEDREPKHDVNNKPGDREMFLQQIRNKTFNLRHTATAKSSVTPQPTINDNVAAILEKAKAIRQAFVGSDTGGDNDNWSDG